MVIGDSVTSIGSYAFAGCSSLTSVVIPDSVTSIGSSAFYDCTSLTSVSIGDSVTSIGDEAFRFCSKLVEVYNLSSLDITKGSYAYGWVGYYALNVYTSLEEKSRLHTTTDGFVFYEDGNKCYLVGYIGNKTDITLPESYNGKNYEIYWFAFAYCDNLTSVSIGDGVTSIGEGAFARCSSLKSVSIGDSVTSIGSDAFYDCDSLTSVSIGDSVTSIGLQAFYNCSSLTSVKYRGTEAQWNAITKGTYWNNNTGNYTITYNYKGD